ncbi:MAG TPA: YetF domain-containing protein [Pyrinomonadaceae bacterium]|jgi:uncharacterized membrane protein YcaP (DUF421 family)
MDTLFRIDWKSIFVPTTSVGEIVVRGTLVYLLLFFILRFLRREAGALGISDLLVVVLIADAAQNGMAGDYKSVTEGALLVGVIAAWDFFLDWLGYHFPAVQRLLRPAPLPLVRDGRVLRQNLRKEMISMDELQSQLREQGVSDLSEVRRCYLEGDGRVSVIRYESGGGGGGGVGGDNSSRERAAGG